MNDLFFFGSSSLWVVIYVELGFGFWLGKRGCFSGWVVLMVFEWVVGLAMFWLGRY